MSEPVSTVDEADYIYGVHWDRYGDDRSAPPASEVCWFDSRWEAVQEFNHRGDKYAASQLVRSRLSDPEVLHPGVEPGSQWDDDYAHFYYEIERGSCERCGSSD